MEQRWSERRPVRGHVRVGFPGGAMAETGLLDLSLGGIGIAYHEPAEVGERVRLTLWLDDLTEFPQPSYLAGEVIYRTADQLGIAFLDAGIDTVRAFRTVLGTFQPVPVTSAPAAAVAGQ